MDPLQAATSVEAYLTGASIREVAAKHEIRGGSDQDLICGAGESLHAPPW